jgi:hypothetical protein
VPNLLEQTMLSREPMTVQTNFLRRSPDAKGLLDDEGREPGAVYTEYVEVWKRLDGVELSTNKERVSQVATGRRFAFVDQVTSERYDDDASVKAETDPMPYILSPSDFTFYRLREVS